MARKYANPRMLVPGRSIQITYSYAYGYLTSSGTSLNIALSLMFVPTATIRYGTYNGGIQARQNGVYLLGDSNGPAIVSNLQFLYGNILQATYTFESMPKGAVNNDTVAITLSQGNMVLS